MLDELNKIKFESNVEKQADLTPMYQLTKMASDTYHLYSFEAKDGKTYNTKGLLKTIASLRGGSYMSAQLTKHLNEMGNYDSVTITADSLKLSKSASAEHQDHEPWKLVAVNGVEYFVKAEADDEDVVEKEASDASKIAKTASVSSHNYTVCIKAHNIAEIAKIANFAEETMGAQKGSFETNPTTASISFVVASPDAGYQVQDGIHKALENGKIFLPQDNVVVADESGALCGHHHGCPCCGGNPHQDMEYHRDHHGMHGMQMPGTQVMIYADKPETLQEFAAAHEGDMEAKSSEFTGSYQMEGPGDANTSFQHDNGETLKMDTFASILDSFLHKSASVGFDKAAADLVMDKTTKEIKDLDDPAAQELVKSNPEGYEGLGATAEPGAVPNAPQAPAPSNPADQPVRMEEKPEGQGTKVNDPNEKQPQDTKQRGDDGVKRWKGMREDPKTGKYVVYITETEQHIYDNLDDAMNFMVRK